MSALNRPDNFAGRVAYAAAVISNGRNTSRAFDNCFENCDGDEVCAALLRRAERNPRLAANLWRYVNKDSATEAFERLKGCDLVQSAERSRRESAERHNAFMCQLRAKQAARTYQGAIQ